MFCSLWSQVAENKRLWRQVVLKVSWENSGEVLDSRVIKLVAAIKISAYSPDSCRNTILCSIVEGNLPNLMRLTLKGDLRPVGPSLLSRAIVRLEKCDLSSCEITGYQQYNLAREIMEAEDLKLRYLENTYNSETCAIALEQKPFQGENILE